jgi:hypothetical protein
MIINIVTTDRRKTIYLPQMMASLVYDGGLNFIAGGPVTDYLTQYGRPILLWTDKLSCPRIDCTKNHIRAIGYGDGPVLVCEDDIVFLPGWLEKLNALIAKIKEPDYIIDIAKTSGREEPRKVGPLLGAQALYYSSTAIRSKVVNYLKMAPENNCCDFLIGRCVGEHYIAQLPMVKHIGAESTFNFLGHGK